MVTGFSVFHLPKLFKCLFPESCGEDCLARRDRGGGSEETGGSGETFRWFPSDYGVCLHPWFLDLEVSIGFLVGLGLDMEPDNIISIR